MMRISKRLLHPRTVALALTLSAAVAVRASDLDTIGVTLLRQVDSTLTGTGIHVAQAEVTSGNNDFEVNPSFVAQPASLFTWYSSSGSATVFPNAVGIESGHADAVAANFYGTNAGTVPQVSHLDNYEALYFVNSIINALIPTSIPARVVNQSFVFDPSNETAANNVYDKYIDQFGTFFASGVGNSGTVAAPGTCYNGVGVGLYGFASAYGPTTDGRCKPDLVGPDQANVPSSGDSYAVPYVSGSAALLLQAAIRGDGGASVTAATNSMTIKALLLNGAVKPADWTNSIVRPLDSRYGAGIVNVFNSWNQLKGRRRTFIESTSNAAGAPHPPGANGNNELSLVGWDNNSITNPLAPPSLYKEQVNHYYFQLTGTNAYTLTSTLTWNRQQNQTTVNDLNLFLFNCANSNLVLCSTSAVDNVEHLFIPSLPPGRYDLQVQKNPAGQVSASETYSLAFEFFNLKLTLAHSGSNAVLSWPVAPTGFRLASTASLTPPITWTDVPNGPVVSNNTNVVTVPIGAGRQFFRLLRP